MTVIVFIACLVAVYATRLNGVFMIGPLDVYQWAFLATTLSALVWSILSRKPDNFIAGFLLALAAILSIYQWSTIDPVYTAVLIDLGLACWFIIFGRRPWEFICGFIFLLSLLTSFCTELGYIPNSANRPPMVIAWSHPDITAILGHLAAIVVGAASGDSGGRFKNALGSLEMVHSYGRRGISSIFNSLQSAKNLRKEK